VGVRRAMSINKDSQAPRVVSVVVGWHRAAAEAGRYPVIARDGHDPDEVVGALVRAPTTQLLRGPLQITAMHQLRFHSRERRCVVPVQGSIDDGGFRLIRMHPAEGWTV